MPSRNLYYFLSREGLALYVYVSPPFLYPLPLSLVIWLSHNLNPDEWKYKLRGNISFPTNDMDIKRRTPYSHFNSVQWLKKSWKYGASTGGINIRSLENVCKNDKWQRALEKDRANPKLRWKAVWGPIDLSSNLKENSSKDIKIYK